MKIYTSYFGNAKKLNTAGIEIINIALYGSRFVKSVQLVTRVTPTRYMISGDCKREEYISMYKDILNKINPKEFLKDLKRASEASKNIGKNGDVALCCHEKPGEFCHRHLLAEWLKENTGIEIKEFGETSQIVKKVSAEENQASLFD